MQHITESKNALRDISQLEDKFELPLSDLHFVVQCLAFVLKESFKVILKPTVLQKNLIEYLKLEEHKADEFVKFWSNATREQFGNLDNRLVLSNISWELDLATSDSISSANLVPEGRIKLDLKNFKSGNSEEIVILDKLNEEDLIQIYNNLENIQKKLDSLL